MEGEGDRDTTNMSTIIVQGMTILVAYGWPARDSDDLPPKYIRTTDADDREKSAHYFFSCAYPPLLFNDTDDAQRTIDRFHIPDAKPMRWGR